MRMLSFSLICALLVGGWLETAHADVPPACAARYPKRRYEAGIRSGEQLAQAAWNKIGAQQGCDALEQYTDILVDNITRLTLYPTASDAVICAFTGTADGVYNKIDEIWAMCQTECGEQGRMAGEMIAQIYCDLSIALLGLENADEFIRGPVRICGHAFETNCDSEYVFWTHGFPDPNDTTLPETDRTCLPYTRGTFESVWEQTRINQCCYYCPDELTYPPIDDEQRVNGIDSQEEEEDN